MDIANQKRRMQNRNTVLFLMVPTAIFAKIIQLFFLPEKYFFDSWRIVDMLVNGDKAIIGWKGYKPAVAFHKQFNVLYLTNEVQFSIFYGMIFTPLCIYIVSRVKEMGMREVLFVLMAIGVLNIYVFNINKEVPQFLYFFAIYIVISLPLKNYLKVLGCAGILYWESVSFRSYYIIMASLIIAIYIIFRSIQKVKVLKKKHILLVVILLFTLVFLFFYFSSFIRPKDYYDALGARSGSTSTIDEAGGASTAIRDVIEVNGDLGLFMIDYIINAVRMMIPIELIIKSPGYIPFCAYQIFIMTYYFKTLRNIKLIDSKVLVAISCFTAYFLGSAVFEPDFGSWTRHEATTFSVLQFLVLEDNYNNKNEEKNS